MDKVYIIIHDGGFYDGLVAEGMGFFDTAEQAQAAIDTETGDLPKRYSDYCDFFKQQDEEDFARYEECLKDYEVLIAGGRPAREPLKPEPHIVRTFDEWLVYYNITDQYEVMEIKRDNKQPPSPPAVF